MGRRAACDSNSRAEVAGDEVAGRLCLEGGRDMAAQVDGQRAAGVEGAAGWRLRRAGKLTAEGDLLPAALAPGVRDGDGAHERLGAGVEGAGAEGVAAGQLDDRAEVPAGAAV